MAYQVTTIKQFTSAPFVGEQWENVYHFEVLGASEALSQGVEAAELEMAVSANTIKCVGVRVYVPGDSSQSRFVNPDLTGAIDPAALGGFLPLFNTMRVVLADTEGRPEQKYLRLGASAANIGSGSWDGEFVEFVQDNYATPLLALLGLCGPTGNPVTAATALAPVQIRQLGWKRRTREGFHRGWVPD